MFVGIAGEEKNNVETIIELNVKYVLIRTSMKFKHKDTHKKKT